MILRTLGALCDEYVLVTTLPRRVLCGKRMIEEEEWKDEEDEDWEEDEW